MILGEVFCLGLGDARNPWRHDVWPFRQKSPGWWTNMKIYFTQRVIGTGMLRIEPKQQKKVPATVAPWATRLVWNNFACSSGSGSCRAPAVETLWDMRRECNATSMHHERVGNFARVSDCFRMLYLDFLVCLESFNWWVGKDSIRFDARCVNKCVLALCI